MTRIATDIVDVYVFRRLNARVQFLLLQRRNDVPMARTWQAFHHEIAEGQAAHEAARNALHNLAGLTIDRFYSADFINQFYDEARDAVVLAPVLAVTVADQSSVTLADDFESAGWFDRDEATARLPFSGQRWAVRHIDEIMSIGESEAELYRFEPTTTVAENDTGEQGTTTSPVVSSQTPTSEADDVGLEPLPEHDPDIDSANDMTDDAADEPVQDTPDDIPNDQDRQV
jgi:dATP pyrophosphohydrolase